MRTTKNGYPRGGAARRAAGADAGVAAPNSGVILSDSSGEVGGSKQGSRPRYLHIEIDRGIGDKFELLALGLTTKPDYIDTFRFLAPAVWRYRAQYQLGDEPVGQWSDVASVPPG